ncbi:MAG TPA: 50S ribosomal protein L23 [Candidatus Nanoarchaeia archaeon]|nr:50S ribosomal protein L23 [Candidatus Nanoarchaeia archaeon]
MKDPYTILKHPITTEKVVHLADKYNKLLFAVHKNATKQAIKHSFEQLFNAKVLNVNTYTTPLGEKRAYITLSKEHSATDITTKLGGVI